MFWKNEDGNTIKRLVKYLSPFKNRVLLLCLCYGITTAASFSQPLILRAITDKGMYARNFHEVFKFSIALFVVYLIWQTIEMVQAFMFADFHNELSQTIYTKAFKKLLHVPISYFKNRNNAEIINRISTDIDSMAKIADYDIMISATYALRIISGLIGLSIISWKLTILVILMIPVKYLLTVKFSNIKSEYVNRLIENNREICEWLDDNLGGIKEIKLWSLYDMKAKEFFHKRSDYMKNYKKGALLDQANSASELILQIAITCLLYILSGFLICTSDFTIGSAFAFLAYSTNVMGPISLVLNIRYVFAQIIPSSKRLFDLLDLQEEQDYISSFMDSSANPNPDEDLIVFENVDFYYEESIPLFNKLNLTVREGDKIGIIGMNGSGKTTLINLLLGFYKPTDGEIRINGIPVSGMSLDSLRQRFAVVSQEPYLFQDTIERNIDIIKNSDRKAIKLAAQKSGAAEFIERLPQGFLHPIGKNGANLSGGERQKLAVARAFIKDADIIILDEATSNYDVETEKYIFDMICTEFSDKTIILITHRYDQLTKLTNVFRLDDGALTKADIGSLS